MVKQISDEIDDDEEEKREELVLGNDKTIKTIDTPSPSFEESVLKFLSTPNQNGAAGNNTSEVSDDSKEQKAENKLNRWIATNAKCIENILEEGNITKISDANKDLLNDFGLQTLVSIYCTPNKNYDANLFKTTLADAGFDCKISVHKVYMILQRWRENSSNLLERPKQSK